MVERPDEARLTEILKAASDPTRRALLTMLAQDPKTRDMPPMELLGNVTLLIVGGNELEAGAAQVKTMETGEQVEVAFSELADYLKQRNATASHVA